MSEIDYPEHEKLKALNGANQTVGLFIDWLGSEGYVLARYGTGDDGVLYPEYVSIESLIGRFFGIDPVALQDEKQQMLDSLAGGAP